MIYATPESNLCKLSIDQFSSVQQCVLSNFGFDYSYFNLKHILCQNANQYNSIEANYP